MLHCTTEPEPRRAAAGTRHAKLAMLQRSNSYLTGCWVAYFQFVTGSDEPICPVFPKISARRRPAATNRKSTLVITKGMES
jgi:hypothetical protein